MVYQSPLGARDLLPLDVTRKRWIEGRLQDVFHRWGYHQIITSTVERLDTLMAGGAIDLSAVIQIQDAEQEVLGLRPELTASIARAAATRMDGGSYPKRLYYNANVFRRSQMGDLGDRHEFYQAGVELLGASGVAADAEILLLLSDCLNHLFLGNWNLILGEAGLTRSLLEVFPEPLRKKVRKAISHLDRTTLEMLPLSSEMRERALLLFDLRGRPQDVLQRVANLDLNATQVEALNNLKSLVELLDETRPAKQCLPILDLSVIRTFDYYTGIVFEVVSNMDTVRVLGQGGRYDDLLSLYHPQGQRYPGIGFCLNIEDLHYVLKSGDRLPAGEPASDWLVVPVTPQAYGAAFTYARELRAARQEVRVELELGERETPSDVRDYARKHRIGQIAWIKAGETPEVEKVVS